MHLILEQTNLYVVQNGREFQTIPDGMHAFLSLNYMMPIWKLAIIKCYWAADDYIGNHGIRNVMTRTRFSTIFQYLYFAEN